MTKFIADSPAITLAQKATRKARKRMKTDDGYMTIAGRIIAAPLTFIEIVIDVLSKPLDAYLANENNLNAKLEAYIEKIDRRKETK